MRAAAAYFLRAPPSPPEALAFIPSPQSLELNYLQLAKITPLGLRDGSEVKSTGCSSRSPEFDFQQPHGGSQPSVTVVGVSEPSSDVHSQQAHKWRTDIHAGKAPLHMK